jgi:hypothetical protein
MAFHRLFLYSFKPVVSSFCLCFPSFYPSLNKNTSFFLLQAVFALAVGNGILEGVGRVGEDGGEEDEL